MREYKMFRHPDMGYCAMVATSFGWQQVSPWYTSPGRLNYYWCKPMGLLLNRKTNRFEKMGMGC